MMLPEIGFAQRVRDDVRPTDMRAMVLAALLDAHRDGALDAFFAQRPGIGRWILRVYLQPILGTAGDALPAARAIPIATAWLLAWAITQLQPNHASSLDIADRSAWLDSTSWRPAIALMCHYGFATVPAFQDRYYRREGESPADNLCGLWTIGPSTFYRYLDKGRRLLLRLLNEQRLDHRHTPSLRAFVAQQACGTVSGPAWHTAQSDLAAQAEDWLSAIWHLQRAGQVHPACELMQRHLALLAAEPELDHTLAALRRQRLPLCDAINVLDVEAALWRARNDSNRERDAYKRALRLALDAQDTLNIGVLYGRLGKYYEPRDPDRAFGYYQESVEFLSRLQSEIQGESIGTFAKLAWLYMQRNDPRAKAVLERAGVIRARHPIDDTNAALLEQAWGEFWRRSAHPQQALEHQHRTLNIYERLNDQQGIVKAYINLGLSCSESRNYDRAIAYLRHVLKLAEKESIGAEALASTYLNLGICYFWLRDYDSAIDNYAIALGHSIQAGLALHQARAHHNLAEVHFVKFVGTGNPADEQVGDQHMLQAVKQYRAADNAAFADIVIKLKAETLGHAGSALNGHASAEGSVDRLLPGEVAANYAELSGIEQHRAVLATSGEPKDRVHAHLAIAKSYLTISAKEREAALALIEAYRLHGQFDETIQTLRLTYERELTREEKLAAQWRQCAGDMLCDERRAAVLDHLFRHNSISKSSYAKLWGSGLATASKHLGQLTELGLLVQIGNGPSTRYVSP